MIGIESMQFQRVCSIAQYNIGSPRGFLRFPEAIQAN